MSETPQHTESLTLAALPTAASSARSFVISTLERWRAPLVIGDAVHLVEEMVTSAVATTGVSDPTVQWKRLDHLEILRIQLVGLRRSIGVEVWDADPYPSVSLDGSTTDASPLLATLKAVSLRWGTTPAGRGKLVWAELPVYARTDSGLPLRPRIPSPRPRQRTDRTPDLELMERVRDGLERL